MKQQTIDLWDVIGQIEDEIADIDENIADLKSEVQEVDDENLEQAKYVVAANLADKRERWAEVKAAAESRLEEAVEEDGWEGTEFEVKELSIQEQTEIQDQAGQFRNNRNSDEIPQGAAQVAMLRKSLVETPAGAPDDPGKLPAALNQIVSIAAGELSGQSPFDDDDPTGDKGGNEEFIKEARARAN